MLKNPNYIYGPRKLQVPAHINFGTYFLDIMWTNRNNIAMINGATDERLTYAEIVQQSMNFAVSLSRMGVGKRDTIGLMSENRLDFWGAVIGVACAGATLTTFSTNYVKAPAQNPKEMVLTISPWYHVMGLVGTLTGLATGRTGVFLPKFELDLFLKTIEKYKISQLTVVPPVMVALCKYPSKYDFSSVKLIYSGAAPLHKDTEEAVKKKFPNIEAVYQGYGATELTLAATRSNYNDFALPKPGSVGKIVDNTVIKVADLETRKPLGPNKSGEICVKGELLMKGYVGRDNSEEFDEDGFYKTGDIGYYDDDGYFYIVDRLKELIKYKGYQVPPAELEAVLLQNPSVKDAAVIGVEDKVAGELPLAFVVTQPGKSLTEKEVKDYIAERLSNPKHLRGGVRFVEQIPKSASGKILRTQLQNMVKNLKSHL